MKSGFSPKAVTLVFLAILVVYFGGFYGLEHLRVRKGPWEMEFSAAGVTPPRIIVRQPALGLTSATLVFHGEQTTNAGGTVRLDRPDKAALFGTVLYEDLTFLPGVVTLDLFGHEIELMPRVLVINKREVPWQSGSIIELWPTNKPAVPPKAPKNRTTLQPSAPAAASSLSP